MSDSSSKFFSRPTSDFAPKIPFIVSDIIKKMKEINAKKVEGVFRLSGSQVVVNDICTKYEYGRCEDINQTNGITLACVLKAYFRNSVKTDPIIPFCIYNTLMQQVTETDEEKLAQHIQKVLFETENLPIDKILILAYLMEYLKEVSLNAEVNKMSAANLAICFAPNLLKSPDPNADVMSENANQNKIIRIMIEYQNLIFGDIPPLNAFEMTEEEITIMKNSSLYASRLSQMMKRRAFRAQSLVPYVPLEWFGNPSFRRPV